MNGDEFHADRGLGFGVMEFSPNPNPNPPPIRESAFTRPLPSLSSPPSRVLMPRNGVAQNGPPKDPDPAPVSAQAPAPAPAPAGDEGIRYRECLRNHAAALGGHVLDGCGEFMPGAPEAMKCAACGCHRSFHRRESDGDPTPSPFYRRIPLLLPPPPSIRHHHKLSGFPPSPVAASGGTTTESSSEERIDAVDTAAAIAIAPPPKKRFRTKFTVEQKERMMGFANAVGWRMQKQDEGEMGRFCAEIGISRQVLKVWMHNNKHTVRRPQVSEQDQHQQQFQQQLEP